MTKNVNEKHQAYCDGRRDFDCGSSVAKKVKFERTEAELGKAQASKSDSAAFPCPGFSGSVSTGPVEQEQYRTYYTICQPISM